LTEYTSENLGIGKLEIKQQFPELFLTPFSYRDFEERCEHHKYFLSTSKEWVSETEQILLKMVKII
jgi:hypothetical protein